MFKRQTESRNKDFLDYIVKMAYLAEVKEWDNRLHLERIRKYTAILCAGLGLTQNETEIISLAAMLHDVGKSALPDDLMRREGNFEAGEWKIIERHTLDGSLLLGGSTSSILQIAEVIALTHHERWDGSGYPKGLKKEDIPISGRILAVADVYDALTTKRNYKDTLGDNDAMKLILQSSGVLFDPRITRVFEMNFEEIKRVKGAAS